MCERLARSVIDDDMADSSSTRRTRKAAAAPFAGAFSCAFTPTPGRGAGPDKISDPSTDPGRAHSSGPSSAADLPLDMSVVGAAPSSRNPKPQPAAMGSCQYTPDVGTGFRLP